jgi:hypothetical protein
MKKGQVANFHGPCNERMKYDTGFKVLSMKINYLEPFKHKHKHQKLAHENKLPPIPSLHGICSSKVVYFHG